MEGTTESNEYILAAGSCYIANTNENTVKVPQLRFGADAALGYVGWMMCSSLAQEAVYPTRQSALLIIPSRQVDYLSTTTHG